jgi:hypothetical protein
LDVGIATGALALHSRRGHTFVQWICASASAEIASAPRPGGLLRHHDHDVDVRGGTPASIVTIDLNEAELT